MNLRNASVEDLESIVEMLADDKLGAQREDFRSPLPDFYMKAFKKIEADPNNELIVAEVDSFNVGTLQLTYIPDGLGFEATHEGMKLYLNDW